MIDENSIKMIQDQITYMNRELQRLKDKVDMLESKVLLR